MRFRVLLLAHLTLSSAVHWQRVLYYPRTYDISLKFYFRLPFRRHELARNGISWHPFIAIDVDSTVCGIAARHPIYAAPSHKFVVAIMSGSNLHFPIILIGSRRNDRYNRIQRSEVPRTVICRSPHQNVSAKLALLYRRDDMIPVQVLVF